MRKWERYKQQGKNLKLIAEQKGISRTEVKEALGAHTSYMDVDNIYDGYHRPTLDEALRIAELFNEPVESLFSYRGGVWQK